MKLLLTLLAAASIISVPAFAASSSSAASEKLSSGVIVEHLKTGRGDAPKASDTVKVHYRGTLENGTEFDSSYKRGEPISFPLGRVIPCLVSV